jgi:hypothetical protein
MGFGVGGRQPFIKEVIAAMMVARRIGRMPEEQ